MAPPSPPLVALVLATLLFSAQLFSVSVPLLKMAPPSAPRGSALLLATLFRRVQLVIVSALPTLLMAPPAASPLLLPRPLGVLSEEMLIESPLARFISRLLLLP